MFNQISSTFHFVQFEVVPDQSLSLVDDIMAMLMF